MIDTEKDSGQIPALSKEPRDTRTNPTTQTQTAPKANLGRFIQKLWQIRLLRFFVVGAVNTLFSYLVYAALILIGAHYTLATLISTILGVIFNFFTTGRIVFRSMDNKRFVMFTLVYVFTYLVNILLLNLLVDRLRMDKLLAGALVTLPVALLSYYLNSKLTFRDKIPDTEPRG